MGEANSGGEPLVPLTGWKRYVVRREVRTRTTWTFRLAATAAMCFVVWLTTGIWAAAVARGLVCDSLMQPSDAILVDNFDPDYLLFERARQLRVAGMAPRVLVPVTVDGATGAPNPVDQGIADVLARLSRVGSVEIVPIRQVEPISLNAARDIGDYLARSHLRSVIVVTPLFRSRRSALVYAATLGSAGVRLHCDPGPRDAVSQWTGTWHGIQNVVEQWGKLQYYRFWVLPRME
ncbi:MAG TPA: hypothetical protein VMF13_12460 [Luteitalea sp.]|nr:hypothetical protein [Luteitalea sp.]